MPKVTHVVVENILYDVHELTVDTQGDFVRHDVPKVKTVDELLGNKKYEKVKRVGPIPKM